MNKQGTYHKRLMKEVTTSNKLTEDGRSKWLDRAIKELT